MFGADQVKTNRRGMAEDGFPGCDVRVDFVDLLEVLEERAIGGEVGEIIQATPEARW